MKLFSMQLSPTFCHFIPPQYKYSLTPSVHAPLLTQETKFHNHTELEDEARYTLILNRQEHEHGDTNIRCLVLTFWKGVGPRFFKDCKYKPSVSRLTKICCP
jgi:hypothetical protein